MIEKFREIFPISTFRYLIPNILQPFNNKLQFT